MQEMPMLLSMILNQQKKENHVYVGIQIRQSNQIGDGLLIQDLVAVLMEMLKQVEQRN